MREQNPSSEHYGWRSRLYLPHLDGPGQIQLITIRLVDAVPQKLIAHWKAELHWTENLPANDSRQVALRSLIAKYEDAGHGACWLKDDRVASMVENAILHFDGERYHTFAWCVMPNHAHVIAEILEGFSLKGTMHSWKSFTAHEANRILQRSGEFWFREYHDRYIRNERHLASAIEYVESNPVVAGLVRRKEDWRWSSARRRA